MKLTFFGDTVLDKPYNIEFDIDEYVFNLETPLSCDGTIAKYKVNLCQDRSYIVETFGKIPLAVSLANNHVMDFGEEAFSKTKEILDSLNIPYFGAGLESENFNNPSIIEFAGKKIGLLGYSCASTSPIFGNNRHSGSAILELDRILKDIKNLRDRVDFLIVQPHWGIQEIPFPKFSDKEIAHKLIDSGVDLIIGHHAHVIQSYEVYKDKYIFYGLGNFIFPDIDIPTQYDGEKFTEKRVKKQEIEHRRSIAVELDNNFNINFFGVVVENGTVRKDNFTIPKWLPDSEINFKKRLKYYNKYLMLKRFIRKPKLPNWNHFKQLFG
jgi:poly-gamma-glutamate synthesis protein (capsule biosynthesis protein)